MEFPKVIAIHLSFNSTQKERERGGGEETSYYFSIGELDKSQGKRCLEDLYIIMLQSSKLLRIPWPLSSRAYGSSNKNIKLLKMSTTFFKK